MYFTLPLFFVGISNVGLLLFQGRQGVVKQIYRGTVFIYDEAEQENSGFFCCKSQNCEKFKLLGDACKEKVCMLVTYYYLIYPHSYYPNINKA